MTVRIGINPIGWTSDDLPELGDERSSGARSELPVDQCLAEAKEAGYSGVELGRGFPRDADELGRTLAIHGLSLISGGYGSRLLERTVEEELRALEPHAALLRALGAKVVVLAEVTDAIHGDRRRRLSERPALGAEAWGAFGEKLTRVGEHLAKQGLALAYHPHLGTVVQSEDDVAALMASTGRAVRLLLDTGHLTFAGVDPLRVIERFGPRITHVHLKDVRAKVLERVRRDDLSFLDAVGEGVFTVPGDGAIDFEAVLGRLAPTGYEGWLVVEAERDPAVADPLTYAKMGYQNVVSAAVVARLFAQVWCC